MRRPELADVPQSVQNQVTGASHFKLEKLRELVEADERLVFSISTDDELAIEACAHVQNPEIIRYHLDHGAPLSLPTAVALRDLDSVGAWLEHDPTLVHERGAHDFPVLWFAVGGGALEIAELLASHDVPIDQESRGTTALHRCASDDDVELAHWLLEHGADPEAVGYFWDREGQTPLEVAHGRRPCAHRRAPEGRGRPLDDGHAPTEQHNLPESLHAALRKTRQACTSRSHSPSHCLRLPLSPPARRTRGRRRRSGHTTRSCTTARRGRS